VCDGVSGLVMGVGVGNEVAEGGPGQAQTRCALELVIGVGNKAGEGGSGEEYSTKSVKALKTIALKHLTSN
jgi:hypothetical protein